MRQRAATRRPVIIPEHWSCLTHQCDQLQVSGPRGSGRVQLFVVPFSVITIFAVALPSYVTTSRRLTVVAAWPSYVRLACIDRITVPAVGYV